MLCLGYAEGRQLRKDNMFYLQLLASTILKENINYFNWVSLAVL